MENIIDFILPGKDNAISTPELARVMEITEREVRKLITEARIQGEPILAGSTGYFLADTNDEIAEYVESRQKAVKTTCMSIAHLRRKLKEGGAN